MSESAKEPNPERGIGGQPVNPRLAASEARLIRRAIQNGWPISDEVRKLVVDEMSGLLENPDSDDRAKVAAAKVLISADAVNAKREATEADADRPQNAPVVVQVLTVEAVKPPSLVEQVKHVGTNGTHH